MVAIGSMRQQSKYLKLSALLIFLCSIPAVFNWNPSPIPMPMPLVWLMHVVMVFSLWKLSDDDSAHIIVSKVLPVLLLTSVALALFKYAENYWDYRLLAKNFLSFALVYVIIRSNSNPDYMQRIMHCWFRYFIVLILILVPIVDYWSILRVMAPFVLPVMFLPLIGKKYTIITFIAVIALGPAFIDGRADFLRFLMAAGICVAILLGQRIISLQLLKAARIALLCSPILLLGLGLFSNFNILEKISNDADSKGYDSTLSSDSRTFIYYEVIESAVDNDYVLFGRSLSRGYETAFFAGFDENLAGGSRGTERASCEVCILNIFNYFGIVGVIVFFLIFYYASSLALNGSNNFYIPLIGVYVAFRFAMTFIEEYTMIEMNWIVLWMLVAMCFSKKFRGMSNFDFENWVKGVFK